MWFSSAHVCKYMTCLIKHLLSTRSRGDLMQLHGFLLSAGVVKLPIHHTFPI